MSGELEAILQECMGAFSELRGLNITVCYKPLKEGVLGQTRIKKQVLMVGGKKRLAWRPIIEVSAKIRTIEDDSRRREILRYVIVHELVHITRNHIITPKSREHEPDFDKEVQERLRMLGGQ